MIKKFIGITFALIFVFSTFSFASINDNTISEVVSSNQFSDLMLSDNNQLAKDSFTYFRSILAEDEYSQLFKNNKSIDSTNYNNKIKSRLQ